MTFTAPTYGLNGNGAVQLELGRAARDRQDCLELVGKWIEGERAARPAGAPGA